MNKPNHPVIAVCFVIAVMPLFVASIFAGLAWRSLQAGIKAVDKFIDWV